MRIFFNFNRCRSLTLSILVVALNVCVSVQADAYAVAQFMETQTLGDRQKLVSQERNSFQETNSKAATWLYEQGKQQYHAGQYQAALISYQGALSLYQTIHTQADIGKTLYAIGLSYYGLGQYSEALASYQQAVTVYQDINDTENLAKTFYAIAFTYDSLSKYSESLAAYQQALVFYQAIHKRQDIGKTLYAIGQTYSYLSKYSAALDAYRQAIEIFRDLGDPAAESKTLNEIGNIYNELGEYSQAFDFYQQALGLIDDNHAEYRGSILTNIGLNEVRQGRYLQAITFYQQALSLYQTGGDRFNIGQTLNNLGEAYQLQGQYQQSLVVLMQALEIAEALDDPTFKGPLLDTLGSVYRHLGRNAEALEAYQQALILGRSVNSRASEAIILSNIGSLLKEQQQTELAIVFYKQSVNVTESIRQDLQSLSREQQESYTKTIANTYRSLSDLLLAQGRILEAQQVLELLKLQELREFTGVRSRVTTRGIELTPVEQEIATQHDGLIAFGQQINQCQETNCSQLSALRDQRDHLTQQFNQTLQTFDAQIRARLSQDRAALDTEHFSTSAHEIVEAQPGTVMIYALVLDNKLWLLWATAGGVVDSVEVPVSQQKLGETVLQFRQLLSTPNSDISQVQATAKQLYDWLIAPIAPELQKNHIQHLVFSLDRVTRYIPMAALFDGQHYLLENYTVSTVLSAALTHMGDRQPLGTDHTSVLALGLSNAVPPDFGGLPNVPAELNAIVRSANDLQGIYPGLKFLNQQFDDHTLRDNVLGHQIVHIATHGVFVPGRQDQSYLVLGNGHHMSISSIQDLQDLGGVRLVVLSACQTALGEPDQDGIEIAGIAYYFLNGGVNTVMASLWSVNDASTQQLMQHLYHNLSQSTAQAPITRAEALRQAQLSLLQGETNGVGNAGRSIVGVTPRPGTSPATPTSPGLSHPYYWAPFILIGNGL